MGLPHARPPAHLRRDWGPGFAPAGITGGVWLHAYSQPFLTGEGPRQGGAVVAWSPCTMMARAPRRARKKPRAGPAICMQKKLWLARLLLAAGMAARQEHNASDQSITVTVDAFLQPLTAASGQGTLSATILDASGRELWSAQRSVEVAPCAAAPATGPGPPGTCGSGGNSSSADDGSAGAALESSQGLGASGGGLGGGPLGSCATGGAGAQGAVRRSITVRVEPPYELWWPHEFGGQPLYTLQLAFRPGNGSAGSGGEVTRLERWGHWGALGLAVSLWCMAIVRIQARAGGVSDHCAAQAVPGPTVPPLQPS